MGLGANSVAMKLFNFASRFAHPEKEQVIKFLRLYERSTTPA